MWPIMLHETHAHQEGGELYWSVMTKEFLGENGVLKKLNCVEVDWCIGEGGRLVPKEREGTDFELEADMVILAMGFVGPGENRIVEEMGVELDDRGTLQADAHNMTNVAGLFVAGDSNLGQSLVVRAIADGRKAAQGIQSYLR